MKGERKVFKGHLTIENEVKATYEKEYGWLSDGQALFISQEQGKAVHLTESAWALRDCCRDRTQNCLLTACNRQHIHPKMVSWETLEKVHPTSHLQKLRTDREALYDVFEMDNVPSDDNDIEKVLDPSRGDVGASILGAALAYVHGVTVVGGGVGGMHHASCNNAQGSCLFVDIPLSWILLRETLMNLGHDNPTALYIDTDVHHANGFAHARDELNIQEHFFIMDFFNRSIYPLRNGREKFDDSSLDFVDIAKPFSSGTGTNHYLSLLRDGLREAETKLPKPDIIYYLGYLDPLKGDPLGKTNLTPNGAFERDRMVLQWAFDRDIPIVYFAGGGYGDNACSVGRDILLKLNEEFDLWKKSDDYRRKKIKIYK